MSAGHVSHAMRNEEARQAIIWFNDPSELMHWSMPLIEALMICGAVLALLHAFRKARAEGDPAYLYTWLATIFYGLGIEILSYNFVDNFWHGEFTVMLYYNKLPLYIVALYPAVVYPAFMLVRRLGLADQPYGRLMEACCAGFAAQAFYAPFDNMGPLLHWWIWDVESVSLQPFWYSVPVTSYAWMMTLSMAFALVARALLWDRAPDRNWGPLRWLLMSVAVGVLTNVGSILLQSPVSVLGQAFGAYFLAGVVAALMMFANAWVYWFRPRKKLAAPDKLLLLFPVLWVSFFAALYGYTTDLIFGAYAEGVSRLGTPAGNYTIVLIALAMIVAVFIAPAWREASHDGAQ